MKKIIFSILTAAVTVASSQAQILVAGWDFQTTTNGGTAVATAPSTPKAYTANFGVGTLYFDGTNGSSDWVNATSGNELTAFSGSTVNTTAADGTLLSSVTTNGALAVLGGAGTTSFAANGKSAVFLFSMAGRSGLSISLASQRSNTGFTTQLWEYSANGGTSWISIGSLVSGTTAGTIATSFSTSGILSLPTVSGLDGVSDARIRVTFSGATATSGNNRLDNIQLTAVPEPSSSMLMVLGVASLIGTRAFRRKLS